MASTSLLVRSLVHTNQRSLLSGACNCVVGDASVNFKGKNRAYLHSGRRASAEEQQQSTSPIAVTHDDLLDASLEPLSAGPPKVPTAEELGAAGESGMNSEMFQVADRRRRMALSRFRLGSHVVTDAETLFTHANSERPGKRRLDTDTRKCMATASQLHTSKDCTICYCFTPHRCYGASWPFKESQSPHGFPKYLWYTTWSFSH